MSSSFTHLFEKLPSEVIDIIIDLYIHSDQAHLSYPRNGLAAPGTRLNRLACLNREIFERCNRHTWKNVLISLGSPPSQGSIRSLERLLKIGSDITYHVRNIKVEISLSIGDVLSGALLPFLKMTRDALWQLVGSRIKRFDLEISFVEEENPDGSLRMTWTKFQELTREILHCVSQCRNLEVLKIIGEPTWFDHGTLAQVINCMPDLTHFEYISRPAEIKPDLPSSSACQTLGLALASLRRLDHLSLLGPSLPHNTWCSINWNNPLKSLVVGNHAGGCERPVFEFVSQFQHSLETLEIHQSISFQDVLPKSFRLQLHSLKSLTISGRYSDKLFTIFHHFECPEIVSLCLDSLPSQEPSIRFRDVFQRQRLKWPKLEKLVIGTMDPQTESRNLVDQPIDFGDVKVEFTGLSTHAFNTINTMTSLGAPQENCIIQESL